MMRRTSIAVVAAATCAGSVPAHAAPPSSTGSYPVSGRINSTCSSGVSNGTIIITTTVPADGKLDPSLNGRTFTVSGAMCDSASLIQLNATALRRVPPVTKVPNGQSETTNFMATATGWSSSPATVITRESDPRGSNTVYQGTPQVLNSPKVGTITVSLSGFGDPNFVVGSKGLGFKLIDGNYSATITVILSPSS